MPRFRILLHDWPFVHWDLLLEDGDALLTWRLLEEPVLQQWLASEKLPDHRLVYLDYSGPVSGDRGTVTGWDSGELLSLSWDNDAVAAVVRSKRFGCRLCIDISPAGQIRISHSG